MILVYYFYIEVYGTKNFQIHYCTKFIITVCLSGDAGF